MRSLTIAQACAESNIWFKVETEEQQRVFQEEFFRQGGRWGESRSTVVYLDGFYVKALLIGSCKDLSYTSDLEIVACYQKEQVTIIWQQEPSIVIDSLAPGTTLAFTLDPSISWQDTLTLLNQLKNEELAKDFISDKCSRRMEDAQLASLARFLLEKQHGNFANVTTDGVVVKSFILTTKKYLTKRTKQLEYWYKFYRKEVENIVRSCQAGLYQEELKKSHEWEGLSWERRGEEA